MRADLRLAITQNTQAPGDQSIARRTNIADLVAAGDWHAVAHHCSVDVLKTYELAKFINLL